MKTTALREPNVSLLDEWLHTVEDLQNKIKTWVYMESDWSTEWEGSREIQEEPLGMYTVSVLTIHTPNGRLILEPIARNYPGRGIVELFAWPTLFRVRLLRGEEDADWQVRVDSGFILHEEWNRENFVRLASDLLSAS